MDFRNKRSVVIRWWDGLKLKIAVQSAAEVAQQFDESRGLT